MKRRLFGTVALAAVAFTVLLVGAASGAGPTYSNDFETDTAGWFTDFGGTITQQGDGYVNPPSPGGYASDISSAGGTHHARLDRTTCVTDSSGSIGPAVNCSGPFTRWGGYGSTWYGGWTTQVDIYLDAAHAQANADSTSGNLAALTSNPTNPDVKGTRFDYTSAVNNAAGGFMRDFGFNVATGPDLHGNLTCTGWIATAGNNVNRSGADAYNPAFNPQCIPDSGWYTFKHTFYADGNNLKALMEIVDVDTSAVVADWIVTSGDLIVGSDASHSVGCNRYGWFTNQEIWGLPIDNASIDGGCTAPETPATLNVTKFYDANANGTKDVGESDITGWKVKVENGSTQVGTTPFTTSGLAPGDYTASELSPIEANWFATTPTSVAQTLAAGDDKSVSFGNVCTGDGGGLTIGFWGNKNAQALIGADDLAMLASLNLREANGNNFNPTTYAQFKTWLSKATSTNMAYMLSAQLAAMELNVFNGKVPGSALVYAPGVTGANAAGFMTVNALMAEANTELGLHGSTKSNGDGSAFRGYQQTLMNALNQANQDTSTSFVQSGPCSFSFPGPVCDTADPGDANAGYNAIPEDVINCGPPSFGFEAQSSREFGDKVQIDPTSGDISALRVSFNSYACAVSGHWNTGNCVSTGGPATFTHAITAKIYDATTMTLLGEKTETVTFPYRPDADATSCPGGVGGGIADGSQFFNANAVPGNECEYSAKLVHTFNFSTPITDVPGNGQLVWTVAFNTTHYGATPMGEGQTCFGTSAGCPYDSLNVSYKTYAPDAFAGTDLNSDEWFVWRQSGSSPAAEAGQSGKRPLGEIFLAP